MNYRQFFFIQISVLTIIINSCATSSKKSSTATKGQPSSGTMSRDLGGDSPDNVSASMRSFMNSREQMPNKDRVESELKRLSAIPADKRSLPTFLGILSLNRLANKGMAEIIKTTRELMAEELKRDVNRPIPLPVRLELALSSIESKRLSMAEYFLVDLLESKDNTLKAAAHTAVGLIYLQEDKLAEAVASFEEALKTDGSFEAARFNLALIAARFGDFVLAKRLLPPQQRSALIAMHRHSDGDGEAQKICANPQGPVETFNCGLFFLQNKNDLDAANILFDQVAKGQAPATIKEQAFRKIAQIQEIRVQRARESKASQTPPTAEPAAKQQDDKKGS
jgi:tetratricopeptide (TPR) repeat protein